MISSNPEGFCRYSDGNTPADDAHTLGRLGVTKDRHVVSLVADGLSFVAGIGYTHYAAAHSSLPTHTHPGCMELHYCLNGAIEFEIDGAIHKLLPGDVCLTQPDIRHHLLSNAKGHRHYWLLLKLPSAKEASRAFGLPQTEARDLRHRLAAIRRPVFPVDDEMKTLFREAFEALNDLPRGAYRTLLLHTILLRILVLLVQGAQKPTSAHAIPSSLDRIVADIQLHPERHRTVTEMARATGRCESRFNVEFKRATGFPPVAFIANCRLQKGRDLLESSSMSIAEIARSLGYCSTAHFSSQFKLSYGITPRTCRKSANTTAAASFLAGDVRRGG